MKKDHISGKTAIINVHSSHNSFKINEVNINKTKGRNRQWRFQYPFFST